MSTIAQRETVRKSGQTTISTTAVPVTKVGDTSGSGTTFATTSVVDGAAWDLSGITAGEVAVTSDGYKGIITAVDDGNDTLTIGGGWMPPSGRKPDINTNIKPTNGSTVTIHRVSRAKVISIQALTGNTADVYVGKHGTATSGDKKLTAGQILELTPDEEEFLDVTNVYAIAASGSQTAAYMGGGGKKRSEQWLQ